MHLIDTHAHLTFDELAADLPGVLERSREAGVQQWITVGTEPHELELVTHLTGTDPDIYGALGFHPHHANEVTPEHLQKLESFAQNDKIRAIGETGLDYFYDHSPRDIQQQIFRKQIEIAIRLNLPLIIHTREAFDDTIRILDEYAGRLPPLVVHCFSGTSEQARAIIEKGFYISFTGIITFKKTQAIRDTAAEVPLERIMLETDCPFISPEPVRNTRPCEPALMVHTARKLAEVKGISLEDLAKTVTETSQRFFGL